MSWTLQTAHTSLEIEAGQHAPLIRSLTGRAGMNWADHGTEMLLPAKLAVGASKTEPCWQLDGTLWEELPDGQRLTLTYKTAHYDIHLRSIWTARTATGPIEHAIEIENRSGQNITVYNVQTVDVEFNTHNLDTEVFYVCKDRLAPKIIGFQTHFGTYLEPLSDGYHADIFTGLDHDDTGFIPLVMLHSEKQHGLYIGWAWNEGRIHVSGREKNGTLYAGVESGLSNDFCTEIMAGETFTAPESFLCAFEGEIDDGSNILRKYLFQYYMPEENRINESLPKVQWNAFWTLGESPNSWKSEEKNYYSMIDSIATIGVEEVTLDVGWWEEFGDFRPHHERWSKGIASASQYAHDHGMELTLYFAFLDGDSEDPMAFSSKGPNAHPEWMAQRWVADWAVDDCREFMKKMILARLNEHGADNLRSDLTPVAPLKSPANTRNGCHDGAYWAEKGYLEFLDHLIANKPHLRYQNCNCGSTLKGYAIMKRTSMIQNTDVYNALDVRKVMWDAAYCFPMMQLMTQFGDLINNDVSIGAPSYRFRTYLMGAPCAHIETPAEMPEGEADYLAKQIAIYKERIRPLVRYADVYHVLPRPDGQSWDGLELFDPATGKGMISAFRPDNEADEILIPLRGLDENADYEVEYADGTLDNRIISGRELTRQGLRVHLAEKFSAEWIFIRQLQA